MTSLNENKIPKQPQLNQPAVTNIIICASPVYVELTLNIFALVNHKKGRGQLHLSTTFAVKNVIDVLVHCKYMY